MTEEAGKTSLRVVHIGPRYTKEEHEPQRLPASLPRYWLSLLLASQLFLVLVASSDANPDDSGGSYCFSGEASRKRPLNGTWELERDLAPNYWNLTCDLEWGKYSCVHQGALEHAQKAARTHFMPAGCQLRDMSAPGAGARFAELIRGKEVAFVGDSLMRQVLISLACALEKHGGAIETIRSTWYGCDKQGNGPMPCHNTLNCLTCGKHSGTTSIHVDFQGGQQEGGEGKLLGGRFSYFSEVPHLTKTSEFDIIVVENIYGRMLTRNIGEIQALYGEGTRQRELSSLIFMMNWQPQFATPEGVYDVAKLAALQGEGKPLGCVEGVEKEGRIEEILSTLQRETSIKVQGGQGGGGQGQGQDQGQLAQQQAQSEGTTTTNVFDEMFGMLWLAGTDSLGHTKVGGEVGTHGDCLHFCMPGPSDDVARALYTMMLERLEELS